MTMLELVYDVKKRQQLATPDTTDAESVKATVKRLMASTVNLTRTIEEMGEIQETKTLFQMQA